MRAMVLSAPGQLAPALLPDPEPGPGELLLGVSCCGVCRTDLHILDGELSAPRLPLVLGHQTVATVLAAGPGGDPALVGRRVGVPWLGYTCGECRFCRTGRENLCPLARFTGLDIDGGYAERCLADPRFCLPLPDTLADHAAAPLLCAGLIGARALRLAGDGERLGLYGFGSSAHLVCQLALAEGRRVFAFTRADDAQAQRFARSLGAEWAGDALHPGPEPLDAAIIFAPAGELVPAALRASDRGATVVCAGIHMSDIPSFPYRELWHERTLRSVANLTRRDGEELLHAATTVPLHSQVTVLPVEAAADALGRLRGGQVQGSLVLQVAAASA